mgnify:CR=1 FL=1
MPPELYNLAIFSSVVGISVSKKTDFKIAFKFDESIDISVKLGVDPNKSDQNVRGAVTLPNSLGKEVKVAVFADGDHASQAEKAGADFIGLDVYLQKIKEGWTDVDVIVTMPSVMGKLGPLGRILGPRGLMPNPKTGTVTMDLSLIHI